MMTATSALADFGIGDVRASEAQRRRAIISVSTVGLTKGRVYQRSRQGQLTETTAARRHGKTGDLS